MVLVSATTVKPRVQRRTGTGRARANCLIMLADRSSARTRLRPNWGPAHWTPEPCLRKRTVAFRLSPHRRNMVPNHPELNGRFSRHRSGVQWYLSASAMPMDLCMRQRTGFGRAGPDCSCRPPAARGRLRPTWDPVHWTPERCLHKTHRCVHIEVLLPKTQVAGSNRRSLGRRSEKGKEAGNAHAAVGEGHPYQICSSFPLEKHRELTLAARIGCLRTGKSAFLLVLSCLTQFP